MRGATAGHAIDAAVEIAHPDIEVRPSIVGGPESDVYRGRDGGGRFYCRRRGGLG